MSAEKIYTINDDYLLIAQSSAVMRDDSLSDAFMLVALAKERFGLCIEAPDREVVMGIRVGDMVVVSAVEGGSLRQAAMLLELVRTYHQPLLVLPKDHEGTKRLRMVVSAGCEIVPRCDIIRGTHPEQNVICSSGELSRLSLRSEGGKVYIKHPIDLCIEHDTASITTREGAQEINHVDVKTAQLTDRDIFCNK